MKTVNIRFHCAHAGRFEGSGGAAIAGGGAGAGSALALAFARRSSRLCTVRHAGRAGAPSSMTLGSGGGAASAGIGRSSCWIVRPSVIGLHRARCATNKTHLGHPLWIELAPCAELGLDGHEFCDLAVHKVMGSPVGEKHAGSKRTGKAREGIQHGTYYWSWRRSSLSLPTSARRTRTSPARALLKSLRYLRMTYRAR